MGNFDSVWQCVPSFSQLDDAEFRAYVLMRKRGLT